MFEKYKFRRVKYIKLEGMGAYGPLLPAPAEGLGGSSDPLASGGNLFKFLMKKI